MPIVVDASLAAAWLLPDEQTDETDRLMHRVGSESARVPSLFWFEIRSLLIIAERRKRLRPGEAIISMAQLRSLPIADGVAGNDGNVIALAGRHGLTGYDATYLALALTEKLPITTLDRRLAELHAPKTSLSSAR